ncbi:MAG TPA: serine hydrolase, partial [Chthoniobacterales bacterium]
MIFEKGFSVPATMAISSATPNLITGIVMGNPVSTSSSLADIVNELKTLPGETSFLVVRLNDDSTTNVIAHNPESELAIGSAFKLYVLSELAREVNSNERKLTDVVKLDGLSLPSGTLQTWPLGSPLTLHSLAAFMISISDNTAADQLLKTLGRERVERMLTETGHAKPSLDAPFLSTLEMFTLKGEPTHKAADDFLALDAAGRRKFLDNQIASIKRED